MIVTNPIQKNRTKGAANRRKQPAARTNGNGNGKADATAIRNLLSQKNSNGKAKTYGNPRKKTENKITFPSVSAWKIIAVALVVGAFGVFYLSHVFATQELLQEVQQMEREYTRAQLQYADYRLTYDRMIGPKEIYDRARELGLINGGPADRVITTGGD